MKLKLQDKKNYISKWILLNIKNRISQYIIAKGLDYSQGVISMVYNQKYPTEKIYTEVYDKIKQLEKGNVEPFYYIQQEVDQSTGDKNSLLTTIIMINNRIDHLNSKVENYYSTLSKKSDNEIIAINKKIRLNYILLSGRIDKTHVGILRKLWRWLH
jgi:hypothetical protein